MAFMDLTLHRRHQFSEPITSSLRHTLHMLRSRQIPLFQTYWAVNRVYFYTFATANMTESYGVPSLLAMGLTTGVNVFTMTQKDRIYSSLWGSLFPSGSSGPSLPLSRFLSTTGAMITVYAQFNQRKPLEEELIRLGVHPSLSIFLSSATVSMAAQLLSTPLHLLSMDLYRFPERTWRERFPLVHAYPAVCIGRMLRILPAFGGGGYLNEQGKRWKFEGLNK
jgi:hypothetical protein